MKAKFYDTHMTAVDMNGNEHIVTMVGELTQFKEKVMESIPMSMPITATKDVEGVFTAPVKRHRKQLRYAYAICHTQDLDEFSIDKGVDIAKRRIKEDDVLGGLTTNYITSLCPDQIEMILFGELQHVCNNIDKYINR